LRAYAHDAPIIMFKISFGRHAPNTNEYSAFIQDTIRVTNHLGLSFGARYDLQTFSTKYLVSNPLWPDSGKVPFSPDNFALAPAWRTQWEVTGLGDSRWLWAFLHAHSADLQLDNREQKRADRQPSVSEQYQLLRPPNLPAVSQADGELCAGGYSMSASVKSAAVRAKRYFCLLSQFRTPESTRPASA